MVTPIPELNPETLAELPEAVQLKLVPAKSASGVMFNRVAEQTDEFAALMTEGTGLTVITRTFGLAAIHPGPTW
jgi:hypothetical protein